MPFAQPLRRFFEPRPRALVIALAVALTLLLGLPAQQTARAQTLQPGTCFDNGACAPGDYCQKPEGLCDESGICSSRPESCSGEGAGVCGCDGINYQNACTAAQAGVSIAYGGGPCLTVTPTPTPTAPPTPTPTASATPTATPTPAPTACTQKWPLTQIATLAKGQSAKDNSKVSHLIAGHIIDPGSLDSRVHRIEVCAGTWVSAVVMDTTGTPSIATIGSLACDSAGCSGVVDFTEKYRSVSQDGRDRDSIAIIPK